MEELSPHTIRFPGLLTKEEQQDLLRLVEPLLPTPKAGPLQQGSLPGIETLAT